MSIPAYLRGVVVVALGTSLVAPPAPRPATTPVPVTPSVAAPSNTPAARPARIAAAPVQPPVRAGRVYRQEIASPTGDTVVVQVFEPTLLETGRRYPLVLHSHGYGGRRMVEASAFAQRLLDTGYYLISIDERGNGESSGTVRIMSPDFEGRNLVAVLDWAESLPALQRRADGSMLVGSYGGSYGGMYQFPLMGADPRQRLRVIAPDITPHDLTYSLNSGNVVKSGYGVALALGAELPLVSLATGGSPTVLLSSTLELLRRGSLHQDPVV